MDLQLQNDVSLVTASSRGLGKASAKALAREGSHVIINGRDEDRLRETREDLLKHAEPGTRVINVPGDIKREETITKLLETCDEEFDRLDHVVTSAGGPPSGSFLKTDDEDWYEAFELLVMSVVRLVRKAEPFLRADGGGTLVHITSRSVKEALDSLVLSNSVRMSVIGLEKTLSRELAPDIRVNAVLPGAHETGRIQNLIQQGMDRGEYDSYQEGLNDWSEDIPLNRIGDPMELGNTVAFLSSPVSGYINGTALPVDGGSGRSNL